MKRKKPQRPIFTSPCGLTIVSAVAFHCQVRDGSGWVRYALATTFFFFFLSDLCITTALQKTNTETSFRVIVVSLLLLLLLLCNVTTCTLWLTSSLFISNSL